MVCHANDMHTKTVYRSWKKKMMLMKKKKTAQINKQTNENTQCAKIFIYDSITTHTRTHHIIYIFIYVRMHGKQLIRIQTELQKFTHHSTIVHTTYSNE